MVMVLLSGGTCLEQGGYLVSKYYVPPESHTAMKRINVLVNQPKEQLIQKKKQDHKTCNLKKFKEINANSACFVKQAFTMWNRGNGHRKPHSWPLSVCDSPCCSSSPTPQGWHRVNDKITGETRSVGKVAINETPSFKGPK